MISMIYLFHSLLLASVSNSSNLGYQVFSAEIAKTKKVVIGNSFVCYCYPNSKGPCPIIKELTIHKDHLFLCNELYLDVAFEITHENNTKTKKRAYLSQDLPLRHEQKYGNCTKFRKYRVNQEQILVSIYESIYLVKRSNASEFIEQQIWLHGDYLTWIAIFLDAYKESTDEIIYYEIFKSVVALGGFIYFTFKRLKSLISCCNCRSRNKERNRPLENQNELHMN